MGNKRVNKCKLGKKLWQKWFVRSKKSTCHSEGKNVICGKGKGEGVFGPKHRPLLYLKVKIALY